MKDLVGFVFGALVAAMAYMIVGFGLFGGSPCHGDECTIRGIVASVIALGAGLLTWFAVRSQKS